MDFHKEIMKKWRPRNGSYTISCVFNTPSIKPVEIFPQQLYEVVKDKTSSSKKPLLWDKRRQFKKSPKTKDISKSHTHSVNDVTITSHPSSLGYKGFCDSSFKSEHNTGASSYENNVNVKNKNYSYEMPSIFTEPHSDDIESESNDKSIASAFENLRKLGFSTVKADMAGTNDPNDEISDTDTENTDDGTFSSIKKSLREMPESLEIKVEKDESSSDGFTISESLVKSMINCPIDLTISTRQSTKSSTSVLVAQSGTPSFISKNYCRICDQKFRHHDQLLQHNHQFHGGEAPEKKYQCELCGVTFISREYLRKHTEGVHADIQIPCTLCGKLCKNRRRLSAHKRFVHRAQDNLCCDMCGKVMKNSHSLRVHRSAVHLNKGKFECMVANCGKKFNRKCHLDRHMLIHNGQKPMNCPKCEFTCRQKPSLDLHMKRYHIEG